MRKTMRMTPSSSILAGSEVCQEPIQPHFRATLEAYMCRDRATGRSGFAQGDHLAARTGRVVDTASGFS